MPDYQQMYLTMIRASEAALREWRARRRRSLRRSRRARSCTFRRASRSLTLLPKKEP